MKLIIDNLAIEYSDEGEGKILLLLHGWGDSLQTFNAITSLLKSDFRIVRVDLPGFGKSEMPKVAWNLDDYINFVAKFIQKVEIKPHTIVGHSFGGRITIKGTAFEKLKSDKIILIGSAGVAKRQTARNQFIKILTKIGNLITYIPPLIFWREKIKRRLYKILGSDYYDTGNLKETYLNIIKEELSSSAESIKKPTLLIWGRDDTETLLEEGKTLHGLITNSRLEIIDDCGHMVHQQNPEKVVELIRSFL